MNIKNKSKIIKKNQKPIEYDIHLKYLCPKCGQSHWLSFNESSTKNFKIVCYCKCIFKVKQTKKFKLCFNESKSSEIKANISNIESKKVDSLNISPELLDKSIKLLYSYGFTETEAKTLITQSYSLNPTNDLTILVKNTLASLKGQQV